MSALIDKRLVHFLQIATSVLIVKVTLGVLVNYPDYLPPNFQSDFLWGREGYFYGSYSWAFYAHIVAGPWTLICGLILLSKKFRIRFPSWHRYLGRIQVVVVLCVIVPSGFWMARYAQTGIVAGFGFGALSIATGLFAALGWRTAVKRRFAEHERWMMRCYLVLCSAVIFEVARRHRHRYGSQWQLAIPVRSLDELVASASRVRSLPPRSIPPPKTRRSTTTWITRFLRGCLNLHCRTR